MADITALLQPSVQDREGLAEFIEDLADIVPNIERDVAKLKRTPDDNARAIRALQAAASADVREHFAIEADGSFMLDIMTTEVVAA